MKPWMMDGIQSHLISCQRYIPSLPLYTDMGVYPGVGTTPTPMKIGPAENLYPPHGYGYTAGYGYRSPLGHLGVYPCYCLAT